MKKIVISITLVAVLMTSMISMALGEEHSQYNDLNALLPQGEGYQWTYTGFVEYGHTMSIDAINNDKTEYSISGQIHDMSGMQSEDELAFNMTYAIEDNALVQYAGEKIQDSDFSRIELIRTPLQLGNTWSQNLTTQDGETVNLTCEIVAIDTENGNQVYTVNYNEVDGDYYEIRTIKEMVGVTSFEKLMTSNDTEITMTYSLNQDVSGYPSFDQFEDLDSNSWYAHYVDNLIEKDILHGYPDNTVKPHNNIHVSEFTTLLLNSIGYKEPIDDDVWYSNYVDQAQELNIIDQGDFENYDRPINRQEMAKMIVRASNADEMDGNLSFDDSNTIDTTYQGYVRTAVSLEMLAGYPDNTFRPMENLTRAEASKVIVKVMEQESEHESSQEPSDEDILSIEDDFSNYLFQETSGNNVVVNYDSKTDLIMDMKNVMSESLAEEYVDSYFQEEDGELKIIAKDGPPMLTEENPLNVSKLAEGEFLVSQENENMLRGQYRLEIYLKDTEDRGWIMTNRIFYSIDANGSIDNSLNYEIVDVDYAETLASTVENIQKQRGYSVIQEESDSAIVYIGLGEKPTGGYGISIYSVVNLISNKTEIIIKEEVPQEDEFVTQAITYPYILVKVDTPNTDIEVETLDGEIFMSLNNE